MRLNNLNQEVSPGDDLGVGWEGGRGQQDSQGGLSDWMRAVSSLRTGTQDEQAWR